MSYLGGGGKHLLQFVTIHGSAYSHTTYVVINHFESFTVFTYIYNKYTYVKGTEFIVGLLDEFNCIKNFYKITFTNCLLAKPSIKTNKFSLFSQHLP